MRIQLAILATAVSLTLASSSWAGFFPSNVATDSSVQFVAAKKLKPTMSVAKFKAQGATRSSTHPSGCTFTNNLVAVCTKLCIQTASGDTCVAHNSCYGNNGLEIPC